MVPAGSFPLRLGQARVTARRRELAAAGMAIVATAVLAGAKLGHLVRGRGRGPGFSTTPAASPTLLCVTEDEAIWTAPLDDAAALRRLPTASTDGALWAVEASPVGGRLALGFRWERVGHAGSGRAPFSLQVWSLKDHRLLARLPDTTAPAWAPDGSRLACLVAHAPTGPIEAGRLAVWDLATGWKHPPRAIETHAGAYSWAPDSRRLLCLTTSRSVPWGGDEPVLWASDTARVEPPAPASVLAQHQLRTHPCAVPTWSPDGTWLALQARPAAGDDARIYLVVQRAGGAARLLPPIRRPAPIGIGCGPARLLWLPSSRAMLVEAADEQVGWTILVDPVTGGWRPWLEGARLTPAAWQLWRYPGWMKFAFSDAPFDLVAYTRRLGDPPGADWQVWLAAADGTDPRLLLRVVAPAGVPSWGPSLAFVPGHPLLAVSDAAGVYIVDRSGRTTRRIPVPKPVTWLTWSPGA